jgi:hypothetical protein
MEQPTTLYHGSLFKQNEIQPGFNHTKKLVQWDVTESNQWLYATSEREEAIRLGIGSGTEKAFDSERYATIGDDIYIYCRKPIDLSAFFDMTIYLYTFPFRGDDGWVKVMNPHNNIETEWKTQETVRNITVERIDLKKFLVGKNLTFTRAPIHIDPVKLVREHGDKTVRHSFK